MLWREVMQSGTWLYDGSVPCRVHIIRQNYWPYLEPGEEVVDVLNQDGVVFTIGIGDSPDRPGWHPAEFQSESGGPFGSLREAGEWFCRTWGSIEWSEVSPPWRFSEVSEE